MKKSAAPLVGLFKNVGFGIKLCFHASRFYFVLKLVVLLFSTAIPLLNLWLWKEVLNGIADFKDEYKSVFLCLAVYLTLQLATYLIDQLNDYVESRYEDAMMFYMDSVMMEKTSRVDLSFFDSAKMGDRVRRARNNYSAVTRLTWCVFEILSASVNVAAALIVVCAYKWWIGLAALVLLIPYLLYNQKYTARMLEREKEQLRDNRKMEYYRDAFYDNGVQFEIKLNGIGDHFIGSFKNIWQNLYRMNRREDRRHNLLNALLTTVNVAGIVLVLIVSVFDVIGGKIGVGDLHYNLNMATRLWNQAPNLTYHVNQLLGDNTRLIELQEFMKIKPESEKSGPLLPPSHPRIEFCHVTFRYPGTDRAVLNDCSFTLEPHEKIGLIGLNGAGKTTIIKLLFRFYDPEGGCVKLDGVDLKEYDVYALRRLFGVLFQDYVTYCLPLREIIALSDFENRFDDEKLKKVCKISGADAFIKDWADGFDSVLGRYYADNGKSLSGGQWQLVGLARAYFHDADYMILDEPSAALDPISEDRIFDQLYRLSEGKGSVTISHRLSNTTLADKILVIGDGRIIEQGSHEDLLKQNGKYAELFRLQASKYL